MLALNACTTHRLEPYPAGWAREPAADCAALAGSYSAYGEPRAAARNPGDSLVYLMGWTHEAWFPGQDWKRVERVSIASSGDGAVTATFLKPTGEEVARMQVACRDGRGAAHFTSMSGAGYAIGWETFDIEFTRNGDYLVARVQTHAVLLALVIPVFFGDSEHWVRYPRLADTDGYGLEAERGRYGGSGRN